MKNDLGDVLFVRIPENILNDFKYSVSKALQFGIAKEELLKIIEEGEAK